MGVRFCRGDGATVEVMELAVDQVWENHDGEVVRIVGVGPASPFGYRPPSYIVETTGGSGFRYTVLPNGAAFDANWVDFPGGTLVSPASASAADGNERAQGDGRKFDAEQVEVTPPAAPDLLGAAAKHMRDRAATYDKPEGERSMAQTVSTFNTFHGTDLTEAQGWHFMQILKDVRLFANGGFHQDSAEDSTAYAALKGEAKAREARQACARQRDLLAPDELRADRERLEAEAAALRGAIESMRAAGGRQEFQDAFDRAKALISC